jgi:hypothetical protein
MREMLRFIFHFYNQIIFHKATEIRQLMELSYSCARGNHAR